MRLGCKCKRGSLVGDGGVCFLTRKLLNVANTPGSKTPGLVILEHELSDLAVQSFVSAYPLMVSNGWKRMSLARVDGLGAYLNSLDAASPVTPAHVADVNIKAPIRANSTKAAGYDFLLFFGLFFGY